MVRADVLGVDIFGGYLIKGDVGWLYCGESCVGGEDELNVEIFELLC